jgi:hypothetical protein
MSTTLKTAAIIHFISLLLPRLSTLFCDAANGGTGSSAVKTTLHYPLYTTAAYQADRRAPGGTHSPALASCFAFFAFLCHRASAGPDQTTLHCPLHTPTGNGTDACANKGTRSRST